MPVRSSLRLSGNRRPTGGQDARGTEDDGPTPVLSAPARLSVHSAIAQYPVQVLIAPVDVMPSLEPNDLVSTRSLTGLHATKNSEGGANVCPAPMSSTRCRFLVSEIGRHGYAAPRVGSHLFGDVFHGLPGTHLLGSLSDPRPRFGLSE
jgi:hypothetical protein